MRIVIHGNKILWLCNAYLYKGKVSQVQKLFKTLLDIIPKEELNRLVIIGDLNVDLRKKETEKFKLIKSLATQLGLDIIEPPSGTFRSSKLDFALVSKNLKGSLRVENSSLSDHLPIILTICPSIINLDYQKISLPNSKLAHSLTKEALLNANNSKSLIQNHQISYETNKNRSLKNIKRKDYEKKLFHLLTERKNIAISKVIEDYWTDLLNENEKLRFSIESSKAFKQLQNIFGYRSFERRDGGIVNSILMNGKIIHEPEMINQALIDVLKSIQIDKTRPLSSPEPFPDMEDLSEEESFQIIERMATNKAISFDLFSDVIFSQDLKMKTAQIVKDLWSKEVTQRLHDSHFELD